MASTDEDLRSIEVSTTLCEIEDKWIGVCWLRSVAQTASPFGLFGSIDVSYSMDTQATLAETSSTISFLSLMRAIFRAVIDSMPDGIEFRFGSFAQDAKLEFETDELTQSDRQSAKRTLDNLQTRGSTNLWAAAEMGFNSIKARKKVVIVLTDGAPNFHPPEGEYAKILEYTNTPEGKDTTLIIVAIANSDLDMRLMHTMAATTGGYLIYVNDASMGATCLINAMATVCTIVETNLHVGVSGPDVHVVAPPQYVIAEGGVQRVNVGLLTLGSYRAIVTSVSKLETSVAPTITFSTPCGVFMCNTPTEDASNVRACVAEYARASMTEALAEALVRSERPRMHKEVKPVLEACAEQLTRYLQKYNAIEIDNLLKDLDGQLMMGAEEDKLKTWGPGAMYAALNAHYHRICVNFKDPGIQMYQTDASAGVRTKAALKFTEPQSVSSQSQRISQSPQPRAPVDFSAYLNQGGGCIHPLTPILTESGGSVPMEEVLPGTRLRNGATVRFVIRMTKSRLTPMVWLGNSVALTPMHPVKNDGVWVWPKLLNATTVVRCDAVYNVILDEAHHSFEADAGDGRVVQIIALGHGQRGRFAEHEFYGNRRAVMLRHRLSEDSPCVVNA